MDIFLSEKLAVSTKYLPSFENHEVTMLAIFFESQIGKVDSFSDLHGSTHETHSVDESNLKLPVEGNQITLD